MTWLLPHHHPDKSLTSHRNTTTTLLKCINIWSVHFEVYTWGDAWANNEQSYRRVWIRSSSCRIRLGGISLENTQGSSRVQPEPENDEWQLSTPAEGYQKGFEQIISMSPVRAESRVMSQLPSIRHRATSFGLLAPYFTEAQSWVEEFREVAQRIIQLTQFVSFLNKYPPWPLKFHGNKLCYTEMSVAVVVSLYLGLLSGLSSTGLDLISYISKLGWQIRFIDDLTKKQ